MDFQPSERCIEFKERLSAFMDEQIYPAEAVYERQLRESGDPHHQPQVMEDLKTRAREAGLWNMFHPDPEYGAGLSNSDYAPLAELLGRSHIASEACNCSAPDTGNMEVLSQFATPAQKDRWLRPLLDGEIRSGFAMTEPDVASSDATNISLRIARDGDEYVLNGRKWWCSGTLHPHCRILIVMGKTAARRPASLPAEPDPRAARHARRLDPARSARVRLPGSGGPRRNRLRRRARPGGEPDRRRGRGLHDRPGAPRPWAHPSLHARPRRGRARAWRRCARAPAARVTFGQPLRRAREHPGLDRRVADRDRDGTSAHAEGGLADGHRRQPPRPHRDRGDQGRGAEYRAEGRSTARSRCTAAVASPTTSRWPGPTPTCAPCVWPTAPTRSTRCRSPDASSRPTSRGSPRARSVYGPHCPATAEPRRST